MDAVSHFETCIAAGSLSHAYLLWGYGEGDAKTEAALAIARLLEPEPFSDCLVVRPHEGKIGLPGAQEAARFLWARPARSARRTVIVTDAASCTDEAQNAFLKTVEEPPEHGLLIFVARDPSLLLPALQSRLQKIFVPPSGIALAPDPVSADLAHAFVSGPPAGRKDMIKRLVDAEDIAAFDRFAAAVMAELDRDPEKNWRALKELSHRMAAMAAHPTNRRLQWEAVSSYV